MDSFVFLVCLGIIAARTFDISLGTLRTVCVVQGRRGLAWLLGLREILIPVLVAYALGDATGNAAGMSREA